MKRLAIAALFTLFAASEARADWCHDYAERFIDCQHRVHELRTQLEKKQADCRADDPVFEACETAVKDVADCRRERTEAEATYNREIVRLREEVNGAVRDAKLQAVADCKALREK